MSVGLSSRQRSASRSSQRSDSKLKPPTPSITPGSEEFAFEPCAATASFLLYAQRNQILCLHHDTLAIERRFERHREDISWLSVDNVSERGAGRLVVSYDTGSTAIVWDLFTGDEVARFASYEQIRVAAWMRNGNVAFGNAQGNVILFEPSTSEHLSARTIFDPITALAPASDCRTFAIGYLNGSILIATLQPSFTILHTLTTPRNPSPIAGLAWHGSSSKQKSEMLAAQTLDGDLRVWSVPKVPHGDSPCVIRVLNKVEQREPGPCWFAWSKNGRIIQYTEGQTCAWDVRTKRVSFESVPTIENVAAITNYGPTATLFTVGRNYTVQQYDLNPNSTPSMVANIQHPPAANTPPSPPNSIEEKSKRMIETPATAHPIKKPVADPLVPLYFESESSEGEGAVMSPLQKIAQEMDQLEDERRDRVGPLSPVSSRSSASSRSSGRGPRLGKYRYDKPSSSTKSSKSSQGTGTVFSSGTSSIVAGTSRESVSIRSVSSTTSSKYASSGLRKEVMRSPDESKKTKTMDLFPFTKARIGEVPFRTPQYGPQRTPDDLRQQMLSVVFGWEADVEELIRDELARHQPGSAASVLLSKWLGDNGADMLASMVGSESMTSSDWMLLALSSMGQDSQKKVGEAFVQRLLEKGDVHPACAILLGLGENNDAIEVYVSRRYFMEAVLLTCLISPNDWQRQSYLVRKWGEVAVANGKPELAVRCFSCTGIESSEPWFSPRAQDAVFSAQKQQVLGSQLSPPLSPPSAGPSRNLAKMSALKLVTNFGDKAAAPLMLSTTDEQTPMNVGVTPIAESALSPNVASKGWLRPTTRNVRESSREPISARTATPGGYGRRRMPSKPDAERSTTSNLAALVIPDRGPPNPETAIPRTAVDTIGREKETIPFSQRRASSNSAPKDFLLSAPKDFLLSATTYDPRKPADDALPSPAPGVFETLKRQESESRSGSRTRKPEGLHLEVQDVIVDPGALSSELANNLSPPLTGASVKSAKARSIDQYISSLEEANYYARQRSDSRAESRSTIRTAIEARPESRNARAKSRTRDASETRGRSGARYIRPAKRSPSSPVPMSPEDAGIYPRTQKEAGTNTDNFEDERYYGVTSPVAAESVTSSRTTRSRHRTGQSKSRASSKVARRPESPEGDRGTRSRGTSRNASRRPGEGRGRSSTRAEGGALRSPGSPRALQTEDAPLEDYEPVRARQRSTSRLPRERGTSARREASPDRRMPRDRSVSRKATANLRESSRPRTAPRELSPERFDRPASRQSNVSSRLGHEGEDAVTRRRFTRKELAQRELEQRRLSLARRPSAPVIPLPGEFATRPLPERAQTDADTAFLQSMSMHGDRILRSATADPEIGRKYSPTNKMPIGTTSTTSVPIGLPATPRAMRHPRYMSADPNEREGIPAVPAIPENLSQLDEASNAPPQDDLGPLLPATTYGQPVQITRAASAPPEKFFAANQAPVRRGSLSNRGHSRNTSSEMGSNNYKRISPPPVTASIGEIIHENQVVILNQDDVAPPLLAELQHLAGPPPPPPPPPLFGHSPKGSLGVINIAIDEEPAAGEQAKSPLEQARSPLEAAISPSSSNGTSSFHRRGRGSVSENLGMTFRKVTDRMRSTSRSRAKSPPITVSNEPAPYESFPAPRYRGGVESASSSQLNLNLVPPPPPPPPSAPGQVVMEQVISPDGEMRGPFGGYRHPKEVRANMPPEQLQQGVYQPVEPPMI